ncbi:MAG: SDR family oxidoreductase [Jiangellales bacterium]
MTIAIVTGAASGIGYALAEAMVRRGDTVVMTGRSDTVVAAAELVDRAGVGTTTSMIVDVRDADGVQRVVDDTVERHGRLDVLVNNAGVGVGGYTHELSLEHWDRAIDVNIRGVVHGVHAAYPHMLAQRSGHILNVASVAGLLPGVLLAPYAMSKHAVVGLSMSLRGEAAEHGVRVSALCPGVVETPILDKGNPADLPPVETDLPGRQMLERMNPPMPAAALAAYTLRAMARDAAIIVAPRQARAYWWAYRLAPARVARAVAAPHLAWVRRRVDSGTASPAPTA